MHQCNVTQIPRAFVITRWTKNAEDHHDAVDSHEIHDTCAQLNEVKQLTNEIWFDFQSCMSAAGQDKDKLLKMRTHVNTIKDDMKGSTFNSGVRLTDANIYALIDAEPRSGPVVVQNPNISRNKGCGSRLKGGKEKSMAAAKDKRRKCSNCGQVAGHNARKCPVPKK